MDWDTITVIFLKLLAVAVLVFLNGFFVAAEFSLVKIRDTQLEPFLRRGSRRARVARHVIERLDQYLSAAQLGITLASLALGWVGEPVFAALLSPIMNALDVQSEHVRETVAVLVGFTTITFLHITAGEQAPKWLAIQKPLPTSLWVALPLHWFSRAAYPFIWVLNHASLWMLRAVGIQPVSEAELVHSEEELRLLFAEATRGRGKSLRREIALNALELRERIARDVMLPRREIKVFDTEASIAECLELAEKTRHSRFPLCEKGDLDKIVGVVHIKDLYAHRLKARTGADLKAVARQVIYIPETARLERVLEMLLARKLHLAIVVDEYGTTAGMLTLENILEELVGPIQDEFDHEKPLLVQHAENVWEVDGALPLHHLEDLVGESLEVEGVATTSGWVTHQLGGFPKVGDVVEVGPFVLRVEEMRGTQVARLRLEKRAVDTEAEASGS